jgi:hypothetical protein
MPPEPSFETDVFDIFSGRNDRDAVWMDAVTGFASAQRRMDEIAAKEPGEYFIFHTGSRKILATNTAPEGV